MEYFIFSDHRLHGLLPMLCYDDDHGAAATDDDPVLLVLFCLFRKDHLLFRDAN